MRPVKFSQATTGKILPSTEFNNLVKEASIGLGLQEIITFTLTSIKKQYANLLIKKENINCVEIANPMSESMQIFRERLLPEQLEFLAKNQHNSYPQDIFELGKVAFVVKDLKGKEIVKEENHLIVSLCHNEASYTQAKQRLDAILKAIDAKDIHYEAKDFVMCIPKRSAVVTFKLGNKTLQGHIGEIHPQVLANFGLTMPVVGFEICVDKYN